MSDYDSRTLLHKSKLPGALHQTQSGEFHSCPLLVHKHPSLRSQNISVPLKTKFKITPRKQTTSQLSGIVNGSEDIYFYLLQQDNCCGEMLN